MLNHVIFNSPPKIRHFARQYHEKNRQKLKTQRMKILTRGETFIISTALILVLYCNQYCTCFNLYQNNQESVKSPPAVTFPKTEFQIIINYYIPQHEARQPPCCIRPHGFPRSKGRSIPRTAFPLLASRWHPFPGSKGRSSAPT